STDIKIRKFSPDLTRVQNFMSFRACLGPQKADSFAEIIIIIIIKAASSDMRALAPPARRAKPNT
ncbi:hypothetical protein AB8X72_15230, partial [Listeria monocytogenes]|uniref:hypothetical protein n=1 Tax=Listeria monocytogenes TaxID=1639 RepID=UPI00350E38B5